MNVHHKFIMKSIFNQSFALQSSRSSSQVVFFPALLGDTFATGLYRFIWLPAACSFVLLLPSSLVLWPVGHLHFFRICSSSGLLVF